MNYGKRQALAVGLGSKSESSLDSRVDMSASNEKSRNMSEKRRRDQFNMLINELCSMVSTNSRKMDKSSVLKSTIAYLRAQKEIIQQSRANEIKEGWKPSFLPNDEFAQIMLESMNSFLLMLNQSGTVLYASEGVTSLLNILPSDLMNNSIYDHTHPEDRMKIYNLLTSHHVVCSSDSVPDYKKEENQLVFTCHLRVGSMTDAPHNTLYELVECCGNFRKWNSEMEWAFVHDDENLFHDTSKLNDICFYCTASVKQSQLNREISIMDNSKKEFTSRHSLEWNILFLDRRGPPIVGYLPFEVLGTSGYDYYHPSDLEKVARCHKLLMQTGESTSVPYRFLTKGQQWIWLQTRYYITYNQWNSKPEFIVCTNTVVSYLSVRKMMQGDEGDGLSQRPTSPSPSQSSHAPSSSTWSKFCHKRAASDSDASSIVGTSERIAPQYPTPNKIDSKMTPRKTATVTASQLPLNHTVGSGAGDIPTQPGINPIQGTSLTGIGSMIATVPQQQVSADTLNQVIISEHMMGVHGNTVAQANHLSASSSIRSPQHLPDPTQHGQPAETEAGGATLCQLQFAPPE